MACSAPQIDTQNASTTTGTSSSSSVGGNGSGAANGGSGGAGTAAIVSRPPRFTMEGVGARVIRGPDWKWGKQVRNLMVLFFFHNC